MAKGWNIDPAAFAGWWPKMSNYASGQSPFNC